MNESLPVMMDQMQNPKQHIFKQTSRNHVSFLDY